MSSHSHVKPLEPAWTHQFIHIPVFGLGMAGTRDIQPGLGPATGARGNHWLEDGIPRRQSRLLTYEVTPALIGCGINPALGL